VTCFSVGEKINLIENFSTKLLKLRETWINSTSGSIITLGVTERCPLSYWSTYSSPVRDID